MPDRARLIFATFRPPFPLDNGGRIRTHRLARGLSEHFDLTLVTYADGPTYDDTQASRADLEGVLPGVRLELVPFPPDARTEGPRVAATRGSIAFGIYDQPAMRSTLRELAGGGARLLHLDDPGVGLAGIGSAASVTVVASHDIHHRVMRAAARQAGIGRRAQLELEWRKVAAEERRLWRRADVNLAVSEIDAATMRAAGAQRVALCPNGADPHAPLALRVPAAGEALRLLFVGSGHYWPYAQGLRWLVDDVLARVEVARGVVLDVVGHPPEMPVRAPGVTYHGVVPDVIPFYERAHALVVPLFEGSGTRLKIVESMALGRPVISTRLGAEGLGLRPGDHYVEADSAQAFATAIERLDHDLRAAPDAMAAMTAAAREAIRPLLWPRIAADLATLYADELAAQRTTVR